MADKILSIAGKWRDIMYLVLGIITCLGIVYASGIRNQRQEDAIVKQTELLINYDKRLNSLEGREEKRDSLFASLTLNQKSVVVLLCNMNERMDNWETEHIKLMKLHNIYPDKLYRGTPR